MLRLGCGIALIVSCLGLALAPPASAQKGAKGAKDIHTTLKTIAVFKTWAKVIETAGLDKLYGGTKPTVQTATMFAPNEDAFTKLKKEELAELLEPKNKAKLIRLVTYHTIEGQKLEMEELGKMPKVANALLKDLTIKKDEDGNFKINGALVVTPDVPATNGVIHGIDTLLTPLK
jgi:uncharacterized surface protein with fasciclin (FAS1) repeats